MSKKINRLTLAKRVAEEAQLLAEEKWIIGALNKIKKQRNSLQIERLQLESMKSQMTGFANKPSADYMHTTEPRTVAMMQTTQEVNSDATTAPNQLLETEALCNKEELNLNVTHSIFSKITENDLNEEEDDEDDDEDCEDLLIDINMLMNAMQKT